MVSPTRAVFLSYASEDTEPAALIAGALQAAGLEVWFDKSELRGGDAWDSLIRRQVKECALFVPVISAHTEARSEGYFRLEWKLAVDRSHLMAEDQAFIVPVAIDGTREASARVPEGFHARQWVRLSGGQPTPAFVEHVRHLLDPNRPVEEEAPARSEPAPVARRVRSRTRSKFWMASAAVIVAAIVIARPSKRVKAPEPETPAIAQPARDSAVVAPPPTPPVAAEGSAPPTPAKPAPPKEPAKVAMAEPKVTVKRIETGPLRPAVLTNEDVQPIQVVQTSGIGAPKPTSDWHIQVELAFWETIKTSTMVEDFEEYLKQYPDGRFAGLARNRIKAIGARKK